VDKHKTKALDEECLCSKCPLRFQCFTQERIFSDPLYQGLYEALIGKGRTKEGALDEVVAELKFRMGRIPMGDVVGVLPNITISPLYSDSTNSINVSYTMRTGEEVSWHGCCSR